MSSSRVLLVSAVLVGLVTLTSCRSLGELSEQKTYSSAPSYGGSPTPTYHEPTPTPTPSYGSTPTPSYGTTPTPSYGTTPSTPAYGVPEIPKHGFVGSCDYWKSHPDMIVAVVGSLGNIGKTFGAACSLIVGKKLENLNSIVNKKFPFTTQQVKDCIIVAATSDGAASAQAGIFKKANEHHY